MVKHLLEDFHLPFHLPYSNNTTTQNDFYSPTLSLEKACIQQVLCVFLKDLVQTFRSTKPKDNIFYHKYEQQNTSFKIEKRFLIYYTQSKQFTHLS